jgi:hypothetical protein
MILVREIATTAILSIAFSFRPAPAEAAMISIIGTPYVFGDNLSVTITSERISLSDYFDQYADTNWAIAATTDDANGGVQVTYTTSRSGPPDDPYGAWTQLQFQILPDSGALAPEAVAVDVWGSSLYRNRLNGGCCVADPQSLTIGGLQYSADESFRSFSETLHLLTNTTYNLDYFNVQYVEGYPQGGNLPRYFQSRQQYDSWVTQNGTSGTIFASVFGFMNWNFALRPNNVPEPGTLALLVVSFGLMIIANRRRVPAQRLHLRERAG